ncbi:hypothetical protein RISK_003361 [Rhodopirellula islandica]|uniref:Uncharacterized protein n=1 Tax=Rhodopirellula islandica TaxID=595434 RepID=A0A0J1EGS0_RHOIS|nr:hypothetical protein RISK_003361 [Rhodopirellula islandica]
MSPNTDFGAAPPKQVQRIGQSIFADRSIFEIPRCDAPR